MDRIGRALGYGLPGVNAPTGENNDDLIAPNNNQGNMGQEGDGWLRTTTTMRDGA